MDARRTRTQAALFAAALALAAERPVVAITVAETATRAGVHRSTFYEWASSPAELVRAALQDELDVIRSRHLDSRHGAARAVTDAITLDVLRHLEAHADLYRRELASGDSGIGRMLGEHFALSAAQLLTEYDVVAPVVPGIPPALAARAAERFVAEGAVGSMAVWLESEPPRDPVAFQSLFARLTPPWWPSAR